MTESGGLLDSLQAFLEGQQRWILDKHHGKAAEAAIMDAMETGRPKPTASMAAAASVKIVIL